MFSELRFEVFVRYAPYEDAPIRCKWNQMNGINTIHSFMVHIPEALIK